jgi:hypothetical protein
VPRPEGQAKGNAHGEVTADVSERVEWRWDSFPVADDPEVITSWLKSKWGVRQLQQVFRHGFE